MVIMSSFNNQARERNYAAVPSGMMAKMPFKRAANCFY